MKKVHSRIVLGIVVLLLAPFVIVNIEAQEGPFEVKPMDVTVLWSREAELHGDLKFSNNGNTQGEKPYYWVQGWNSLDDYFVWKVNVQEEADYKMAINYSCIGEDGSQYEIVAGDSKITGTVVQTQSWHYPARNAVISSFVEVELDGTLHLPKGISTIELRATKKPETGEVMALYTVELTPPSAEKIIADARKRADKMRANTDWFVDAKYGLTFHWTARSQPRRGPQKPYCDAVRDFDVKAFADMVEDAGAGYVIFTSSHDPHYFPAPIQTIEKILPGNTCERDLIGDLADALNDRGIKFIMYYTGCRTRPFSQASGWNNYDKTENYRIFADLLTEIGQRYGKKIAGYWFDMVPYNVSHHFETLFKAAKVGNPDRIITWNGWIQRKPTDFQEYWSGEVVDPVYPFESLDKNYQPHVWIIIDDSWVHNKPDTDIGPLKITNEQLIEYVETCVEKEIVVSMNVSIYQDGTISPAATKQLRALKEAIRGK